MHHEQIGHGYEHNVFQSRFPELVLKTPTVRNQLIFSICGFSPELVRTERQEADLSVRKSPVIYPRWRVFMHPQFNRKFGPFNFKSYVIAQQEVFEDHSLNADQIAEKIKDSGDWYHLVRFQQSTDNFLTQDKQIYCVDPTKSTSPIGILDRKGIISKRKYFRIKQMVKRDIKLGATKLISLLESKV